MEKGLQRIEDDIAEKDQRKRNVVIRNVPESLGSSETSQKQLDVKRVEEILDIEDPSDITNVVCLRTKMEK